MNAWERNQQQLIGLLSGPNNVTNTATVVLVPPPSARSIPRTGAAGVAWIQAGRALLMSIPSFLLSVLGVESLHKASYYT